MSRRIGGIGSSLAAVCCAALLSAACAGTAGVGKTRFANQDPVWRVNDRLDTPERPAVRAFPRTLYHLDGFFFRRLTRILELRPQKRALNVNSLGEVPSSTWFTNRIGVRDMSVDEIRRGPAVAGRPPQKPFKILGTKVGGASVGFIVTDARGDRYLLKFDVKGKPEIETAADVIAARLLHACGFNVPEDTIVTFERSDLVMAAGATVADTFGNKRRMTPEDLDDNLAKVDIEPDGTIRGLFSKFIQGTPIGGVVRTGTRKDDPNDLVPHQDRRDLRGQYVIFSWIDHTDVKEDNMLDVWVADPRDPKKHYVKHYLVDFGKSLGALAGLESFRPSGFAHTFDFRYALRSLVTFGLAPRPWEGLRVPKIRGVGWIESRRYEPGSWFSHAPWFAFKDKDRFDAFWGAKIVARFTPAQIRAAVEEGKLTDPRATEYLTRTLIARQRKTVRYWFGKVNPLDRFEVEAGSGSVGKTARLCFVDLMVAHGYESAAGRSYRLTGHDYAGKRSGWQVTLSGASAVKGRVCADGLEPGPSHEGYGIVRVETRRNGRWLSMPVDVHVAQKKSGRQLRVIGLQRH
jgi:hypothetical protein